MSDKIQLIRKEIERLKDCVSSIVVCKTLLNLIDSLPEEPASEGLEKEVHKHLLNIGATIEMYSGNVMGLDLCEDDYVDFARHFAEWQKQQMKESLQTEYEKGRFDMREEMMKDAMEGVVHHFPHDELAAVHYNDPKGTPMSIYVSSKGLSAGDKVKILIVKIEQQ